MLEEEEEEDQWQRRKLQQLCKQEQLRLQSRRHRLVEVHTIRNLTLG
jgi:hypothetical protein